MKCMNCNQEVPNNAKFCRFCGTALQMSSALSSDNSQIICKECGNKISSQVRFCKYCGKPVRRFQEPVEEDSKNTTEIENFIIWQVLNGQLAVKIDEKEIAAYKTIKGVYVAPGTKALFFVNGKYAATLDSGKYSFKEYKNENEYTEPSSPVVGFFRRIANHIANGTAALFGNSSRSATHDTMGNKVFFNVVLIRGVEFPLLYDLSQLATKNLRSDIGLHILCKITNLNDFFEGQLVDKKMIMIKPFAESLQPFVQTVLSQTLSDVTPQEIENNSELSTRVLASLQNHFQSVYSYVKPSQILSLSARHEELERIRRMKEELYVAELDLEHLQQRNDFLNRLQSEEHSQELRMARENVDFQNLMGKIDEDRLLNNDQRTQFAEMLSAQAQLRSARTMIETEAAINKLIQTKLLSQEELAALKIAVEHRIGLASQANEHELTMATIQNQVAQQREALRWKIEYQNTEADYELARKKKEAEFENERANDRLDIQKREQKDRLELEKERLAIEIDAQKQSDMHEMEMFRQFTTICMEKDQSAHQQVMEEKKLQAQTELEHHKLQLEQNKIHATMSFEQIMASNPDITPEAADALAKKFEAEALAVQNDKTAELVRQHETDLKEILEQQMNLTRDIVSAQTQTNHRMISEKQQELERVHADSERHQDRFLAGMQTTVSAVAATAKPTTPVANPVIVTSNPTPTAHTKNVESQASVFCPNCGKKHAAGTIACDFCGASL